MLWWKASGVASDPFRRQSVTQIVGTQFASQSTEDKNGGIAPGRHSFGENRLFGGWYRGVVIWAFFAGFEGLIDELFFPPFASFHTLAPTLSISSLHWWWMTAFSLLWSSAVRRGTS